MKRWVLLILLCVLGAMVLAYAGTTIESKGPVAEPNAVESSPILVKTAEPWIIRNDTGTHLVAYYQKVTMPDGTTQELKSRTALTAEQWKALAQKQWDAQLAAELNKPKVCPTCGGTGFLP